MSCWQIDWRYLGDSGAREMTVMFHTNWVLKSVLHFLRMILVDLLSVSFSPLGK